MKNWWLKLGCFLTGYNYQIVMHSSEVSAKAVKKYLSALIIISILWGFIGYTFTQRYLHGSTLTSSVGALILVVIVIQIERQIILSVGKNNWARGFRIVIGLIMACIGSVIIDQMIFKDDIEKKQLTINQAIVDSLLPKKTFELNNQIKANDTLIANKEAERLALQKELSLRPTISLASSQTNYTRDSLGNYKASSKSNNSTSIPNPKASLLEPLQAQINVYIDRKTKMEGRMLTIREEVENEVSSKTGFLDELQTLFSILFNSGIAMAIWILWFGFLLAIELFVLVSKFGDTSHDYEQTVLHQMNVKLDMLQKLRSDPKLG